MRSISVQKILQLIAISSGLFIIMLSVGYLGSLKGGLLQLLVANPIFAGFLTGLPLIPLIHSAKQKYILEFYIEVGQSSYESGQWEQQYTYEIPVAGWLNEVRTTVFQETQPSTDLGLVCAWAGDSESLVWEQSTANSHIVREIMAKMAEADHIAEFQTPYPVQCFFIEDAVDSNDSGALKQSMKVGGPGNFFEQGQLAKFSIAMDEIAGGNDTTGLTNIVSQAIIIVGAFDRNKRSNEKRAPWVTIVGDSIGTSGQGFHWYANTNLRIANLRATIWRGMDVANQASFVISKHAPDLTMSAGAIEMHVKPWLYISEAVQDATGSGTVYEPIVTAYSRGPFYLKKAETLQVRHESVDSPWLIQFNYIPDFGYTSEFNRRFESTAYTADFTSQWIPLFLVPYDMYVTTVKGTVAVITDNNESDAIWKASLMGYKAGNMLDSNDLLLGYTNANVHGNILGATNDAGQVPWSLADVVVAIETVDTSTGAESVDNTTTAAKQGYAEAVADFYPAGSQIGFWLHDDMGTNIGSFYIEMKIEALNRIKTQNVGTNSLTSSMVVQVVQ